MLLSVYNSYEEAGDQASTEAGAVLSIAQDAVVLGPLARREVLGTLRCYTRAVIGPDRGSQADDGRPSPIADAASNRITEALTGLGDDPRAAIVTSSILADDSTRIQGRIRRINEGRPSVPTEVWILLLVTVVIMVAGLAALGHPAVRTSIQVGVLIGTTVVFGLTLLVVHDLDRPYDGLAKIEPAAMRTIDRRIAVLPGGNGPLPCDLEGRAAG